jgi:hypothetical protein
VTSRPAAVETIKQIQPRAHGASEKEAPVSAAANITNTTMPTPQKAARLLGGVAYEGRIDCPGPGRSPADRSLHVKLDLEAPEGFIAHSSVDDVDACRAHVCMKLGLPPPQPEPEPEPSQRRAYTEKELDAAAASVADVFKKHAKEFAELPQDWFDEDGAWIAYIENGEWRRKVWDGKHRWAIPRAAPQPAVADVADEPLQQQLAEARDEPTQPQEEEATPLVPDRDEIERFTKAIFRYADPNSFLSIRAFDNTKEGEEPLFIEGVRIDSPLLTERLYERALQAAQSKIPMVFSPPMATFKGGRSAKTEDIVNGLVIAVECDANPSDALNKLGLLLGEPTVTVKSGGAWENPKTGLLEDKLHLYWRLREPTCDAKDHKLLREANRLAARLVGADRASTPVVHPMRYPGSWHRKADRARLCRVMKITENEVELHVALELLRAATGESEGASGPEGANPFEEHAGTSQMPPTGDLMDITAALYAIPNDNVDWDRWNKVGMATYRASDGHAFAAFDTWSRKSAKYDQAATAARWNHYRTSPPDQLGMGSLIHWAREAMPGWRKPSDYWNEALLPGGGGTWQAGAEGQAGTGQSGTGQSGGGDRSNLLVSAWLDREIPSRDYLLGDVICTTSRWLIFGNTGVGKTLFGMSFAGAIAAGAAFLNWEGRRRARAMYLDGELPVETFKERMQLIAKSYGADIELYGYNREVLAAVDMPPLNTEAGQKWLLAEIEKVKPDIIFFDSIMCLLIGSMSEEEAWAPMKPLVRHISSMRIAQVWLHHTGHDTSRGFGTKTREWEMDTVLALSKANDEDEEMQIKFNKARLRTPATAKQFESRMVGMFNANWTANGKAPPQQKKARSDIDVIRQTLLATYSRLAGDEGVNGAGLNGAPVCKVSVDKLREEMKSRGFLEAKESGGLTEAARRNFHRVKNELLASTTLVERDGLIWKP